MNYGHTPRQKSVLESYIVRACDPTYYGPDLALNLEICDVINEKQKNTPREAAIYIVRLINHKNMHVGMLALTLLDNCVKNCGYPFHLQIASKEFLNALVRRFPERPLMVPTPIQNRILELIQEWYTTLCKTSRYKEDLVHIRDMHRLLSFKGYRFPPPKKTGAAVSNPADSLKTPAELEEEDRVAMSARLQELIRRGRPADVRAANELVKKMTGFEQDQKPDYVEQASAELNKIMQKATMLNEMLNDVKPGEIIGKGDIFEDILGTCKAAHPKVQKIISDDKDPDNIDTLIRLDEVLTLVIDQYQKVKNGDLVKVLLPENGTSGEGNHTQSNSNGGDHGQISTVPQHKQSSLIDLMDFDGTSSDGSPSAPTTPKTTGNLMDDLMNLSFNDAPPPSWGAAGGISLGSPDSSVTRSPTSPPPPISNTAGGAPIYNVFASPIASVNPISVGSSIPTLPSTLSAQASPLSKNVSLPFNDFEFVSNTGAPSQDVGPVSVPKTLQLKLEPQSAQIIAPFSKKTVTQDMTIQVAATVAASIVPVAVRVRYHVSYALSGKTIEEQGEFDQFP
ncbi:hypothetical protein BGX27_007058 [Mortierella sp. AM989]|nr:hypothetical protein BGX27_007058 [Mortierella sp. AM989]